MPRKRLTQLFPFLIPLRRWQRTKCFYLKMRLDHNRYAAEKQEELPVEVFTGKSLLLNEQSGFDMQYQHNKVDNLKLAAATLHQIVIRPGETLSFWQLVRHADDKEPYKDGLCLVNGKIVPLKGGGLCQISNLLFWLLLHTPLTIVERHPHAVESFPVPPSDMPDGTDATVNEGWQDLKMRNDTALTYQITFWFDDEYIHGGVRADGDDGCRYDIIGRELRYYRQGGKVYQTHDIYRRKVDRASGEILEEALLYHNRCGIGYELPPETEIEDRDLLG